MTPKSLELLTWNGSVNMDKIVKCCSCGAMMRFAYTADFRTGGTTGKWKLLLGEWAEVGKSMLPLNVYICPNCGKIELFAGDAIKDALQRVADKNKQKANPSSF